MFESRSRSEQYKRQRRRFTRRALLLAAGQVGLFGVLGWRLRQLQVVEAGKYAMLAEENRVSLQLLAPSRGPIVDRFGEPVAANTDNLRVIVIPDLASDLERSLDRLARIVDVPDAQRARVLRMARRQSPYIPIVVKDDLSWRQFAEINVLAPALPGVQTDIMPVRRYSHARDMAHIVGYVGAADAGEVRQDPVARLPGFRVGKVGVEKGLESRLRGRAGVVKLEVDARGHAVRTLDRIRSRRGREIVLTIDHQLQHMAMERLKDERRACVVALDARTGEVLVMASTPSFDPNAIVVGLHANEWKSMAGAQDNPLINRATRGQYPPGSTFKMVTALAGLESGVIDADTKFHCYGGYSYANAYFRCWRDGGHRAVRLHKALAQSCDVYFYNVAERLGIERLSAMGRKLGLGEPYDFGLPLQKPGVMPTPDWKQATIGEPWYGGETVIAGIGQGYVLATPLQLAVMTARIATGRAVTPQIARPDSGRPAPVPDRLDIAGEHLEAVRKGMWAVVNEAGGTAGRARLPVAGVEMAGKTGTSQVNTASSGKRSHQLEWHERDHGLFVGFAPVDAPRYAVAAVVEHGGSGSRAASPIVRDVMTALIERDPLARPAHVSRDAERRTAGGGRRPGEG